MKTTKYILYSKGLNVFHSEEFNTIGEAMKKASELNDKLDGNIGNYYKVFSKEIH